VGDTADVTGTVTLNGQPVKTCNIHFLMENGREEFAQVKDGSFTLPKVLAGKYKVAFDQPDRMPAGKKSVFPAKYQNFQTTDVTAEVKPGTTTLTIAVP
jgi:hypothetical protein